MTVIVEQVDSVANSDLPLQPRRSFRVLNPTWMVSIAIFISFVIFLHNCYPVGNNFDQERYFVARLFIPSILVLLGVIIIQRFIDAGFLLRVIGSYQVVVYCIFGFISLQFEVFNGDNLIFITSYMMVYHDVLYTLTVLGIPSLLYLSTLVQISNVKQNGENLTLLYRWIIKQLIAGFGLAGFILLAGVLSYGFSSFIIASAIGVAMAVAGTRKEIPAAPAPAVGNGSREHVEHVDSHSSSKMKNTLVSIMVLLIGFIASFSWAIDFIRYTYIGGGEYVLMFFELNSTQVLNEALIAILVFCIVAVVVMGWLNVLTSRISFKKYPEMIFATITLVLIGVQWLLLLLGRKVLPVRASSLLLPWMLVFLSFWMFTYVYKRKKHSAGLTGALVLCFSFGTLVGMMIGTEPDHGYSIILVGALVLLGILGSLTYGIIHWKFMDVRKARKTTPYRAPRKRITFLTGKTTMERVKNIKVASLLACIVVPCAIASAVGMAGSNQYQILANSENNAIFYLADPMTRIDRDYIPNFGLSQFKDVNDTFDISMARNEYESVQIVMRPINQNYFAIYDIAFNGFTHVSEPSFINDSNLWIYINEYTESQSEILPDRLVPFNAFTVTDGKNHPLWFTFHVPANATAGDYTGALTFTVHNKTSPLEWSTNPVTFTINVRLHVWNFSLPEIPTLKTNFGLWADKDIILPWFSSHKMMLWEFASFPHATLHPNGSINTMDYASLSDIVNNGHANGTHSFGIHLTAFMDYSYNASDWLAKQILGTSTFVVDGADYYWRNFTLSSKYNATFAEYFNLFETFLKSQSFIDDFGNNISWYDEFYFNGRDELDAAPGYVDLVLEAYDFVKKVANATLPIMQTGGEGTIKKSYILDHVDIWCYHTQGNEYPAMTEFKNRPGKQMWIYTTRGPRFPSPSLSTSGMATQIRALGWQCFKYNYTHYLIWDVITSYNGREGEAYQGWGGGRIIHQVPGGYAISPRMELMRDGIEDHDYFFLLRASLNYLESTDPLNSSIPVARDLLGLVDNLMVGYQPDMDYRNFVQLRHRIGELLDQISILA
ncbi:MAG: hypothetical protein ACTSUE_24600 [Promethearchaeota archaeon]